MDILDVLKILHYLVRATLLSKAIGTGYKEAAEI